MSTSKITNITKIKCEPTKVFDITVSKNHNFILNNGLVVHNCQPYQYLRSCLYENRFELYNSERLYDELVLLERNINTGKIDHPPNGHKDVADAVCGAIFNASKYADEYAFEYGEDIEIMLDVSKSTSLEDNYQELITEFENELNQTFDPMHRKVNADKGTNVNVPTQYSDEEKYGNIYCDFGLGKSSPYLGNSIADGILVW